MGLFSFINGIDLVSGFCLVAGLAFVIVEMFHPGFGAPGITGLVLLIAGILLTARTVFEALIMIIILLAILGAALTFVLHSATKGRLSRILILSDSQKKESGFISNEDLNYFLGKEGIATTILRPAGTADFDGVKLDVVSEGEFIPKGTSVKITKVSGRRIVVSRIK